MLRILAVDDEPAALDELVYLLGQDPRVGEVEPAADGGAALRALGQALETGHPVDAVFLDISMPGLDGLDVARVLARFAEPVPVVFVSAHDDFAVPAFEVRAADYLLKPVRPDRLAEAVRRVAERRVETEPRRSAAHGTEQMARTGTGSGSDAARAGRSPHRAATGPEQSAHRIPDAVEPEPAPVPGIVDEDQRIAVELSNVTRFVRRSEVRHVEACGDYVRLHLESGSHLLRVPLSVLESRWREAGFVRVHRRHLVAIGHIEELLTDGGRLSVRVAGTLLPVSRRSSRLLRDLLRPPGRAAAGADSAGGDGRG